MVISLAGIQIGMQKQYVKMAHDIKLRFPLDFEQEMKRNNLPTPSSANKVSRVNFLKMKDLYRSYNPKKVPIQENSTYLSKQTEENIKRFVARSIVK